jgi:outer membrane protein W
MSYMGVTGAYIFNDLHDHVKPYIEASILKQSYKEDGDEELGIDDFKADGTGLALAFGVNYEIDRFFVGAKLRLFLFDADGDLSGEYDGDNYSMEGTIENTRSFLISAGYRF